MKPTDINKVTKSEALEIAHVNYRCVSGCYANDQKTSELVNCMG